MSLSPVEWIEARGGRVPFRDFMAAALYDPGFGYYTRNIRDVGPRGDFSTTATLDRTLLGGALAAWVRAQWKADRLPRHLIEIGGGDGSLARALLHALGILGRRGLRYHLVDISAPLIARQRETLRRFGGRVRWHATIADALAASGGEALVLSNELVDAFPATLYRLRGEWEEISLVAADGRVTLHGAPAPGFRPDGPWPQGQLLERHDSYRQWLAAWLPQWKRGSLLTLDYGDTFPALYHRRPGGTLRAYFAQQRFDAAAGFGEILARFGKQDLTCDVNFTDLRAWGESGGLRTASFETQRAFLLRHQPLRRPNPAQTYLLDPQGPGGAFKVLIQSRDARS